MLTLFYKRLQFFLGVQNDRRKLRNVHRWILYNNVHMHDHWFHLVRRF